LGKYSRLFLTFDSSLKSGFSSIIQPFHLGFYKLTVVASGESKKIHSLATEAQTVNL